MNGILEAEEYFLLPRNEDEYPEEILQLTLPRLPLHYVWMAVLCTCNRHQVHFPVPIEHPIHQVGPSYVEIDDDLPIESDLPIRLEEIEQDPIRREYRRRRYFQHMEFRQKEEERLERRRRELRYLQLAAQHVVDEYEHGLRQENEGQLYRDPEEAIPPEENRPEGILQEEDLMEEQIELPMSQQSDNSVENSLDR